MLRRGKTSSTKPQPSTPKLLNIFHSNWRSNHPRLSVRLADLFLTIGWVLIWLLIFFLSTAALGITTGAIVLMIAIWISVIELGITRWVEHSRIIQLLLNPDKQIPKNKSPTTTRVIHGKFIWQSISILLMLIGLWLFLGGSISNFSPPPNATLYEGLFF